ncbi:MAG TPA: wax ester/triacylglycerol synthase family O-acyltransferase, partial [Haliea salexigens]|nr:wax ester/triacylglycerol synthase family O-acyltransferase [Haliea salexigens]
MDRLSAQDAGFLRIETPRCPFHVAALMLLSPPEGASRTFLRQLARDCGRLNEILPAFNRQLSQPEDPSAAAWVEATHYRPENHVLHYALPQPGRMQDLLQLVTRVHERPLDRNRPLWELHIIEGLPGGRFALYCKTHHALVDGIGAMRMIQSLFSTDPAARIDFR